MHRYKQISIDVDVHRAVENARITFSETENDILRRLLVSTAEDRRTERKALENESSANVRTTGNWTVVVRGRREAASNLRDAYRRFLLGLAQEQPGFLDAFANERSKTRRFIAKNANELYGKSSHLADHAKPLIDGWLYDSNLSTEQVSSRIRSAARICGLRYGQDAQILKDLKEI